MKRDGRVLCCIVDPMYPIIAPHQHSTIAIHHHGREIHIRESAIVWSPTPPTSTPFFMARPQSISPPASNCSLLFMPTLSPGKQTFKESDSLTGGSDVVSFTTPWCKIGEPLPPSPSFPVVAVVVVVRVF
jgi:hypothetical protein